MVHGIPNITVPPVGYSVAHSGKMALPVDSSSLIYSHFEHVSGVAAPKGEHGVSISKLHLLEVLIGQINHAKKSTVPANYAIQEGQLDSLIETYRNQIKQTRAASSTMPYILSPHIQSGTLFSILI